MPRRKLALVRENLAELATDDLAALAGGAPPTRDCYTAGIQCFLRESLNYCNTLDCIRP